MHDRINDDELALDCIKDPEWESTRQSPANIFMNHRVLKRMVQKGMYECQNLTQE
jgi:hypothetical protein